MCYSAQLRSEHADYERYVGKISLKEFAELYGHRVVEVGIKIPKALDQWFADPKTDDERQILESIGEYKRACLAKWEPELFKQRKRLADAERAIAAGKVTKKAENDVRVAGNKTNQLQAWIEDAKRTETRSRDARIYPGYYAPIIIWEDGQRVVKPMMYRCWPDGWPAEVAKQRQGTYNARRDSLDTTWRKHFGYQHGVMLATAFYEHVSRAKFEGREPVEGEDDDLVLKFEPKNGGLMFVACIYSRWGGFGQPEALSFAALTDEPPPEVSAAGHDRCIIPLKEQYFDAWLQPQGDIERAYAILDDRERPYYEHQLAKAA